MAGRRNSVLNSEHVEQRNFISWFRQTYPQYWIFAIPNGGHRNQIVAMKMKAEGQTAGVPDMYVPALKLWIEMKTVNGRVSRVQQPWIDYLRALGDTVIVPRGGEQAREMVNNFIKKMLTDKT